MFQQSHNKLQMRSEFVGGSEISQVSALDAKEGKARGFDNKEFGQNIHVRYLWAQ